VNAAAQIRPGMAVEFTIDAYPGRAFRGTVARVDPTADAGTRQVGVYARLENPGRQLVGGLFATGRIITGSSALSVVVPIVAVRGDGPATYVWVVRNNAAAKQMVVVGARDETRGVAQITSGLVGGERVIAAPGEVTEGMPVRVAPGASGAEVR
jgi:membrane fusion protein (multidrug efflux system)